MSEIIPNSGPARRGLLTAHLKKTVIRIDLTPMVDLGFLLITFFVFTTALTRPRALRLYLPAGEIPTTPYAESAVLTLVPYDNGRVFYYQGNLEAALAARAFGRTDFSLTGGIGEIIRRKMQELDHSARFKRDDLALIIKPAATASYKSIAAALDEVLINGVKHYSFADLEPGENERLRPLHILP